MFGTSPAYIGYWPASATPGATAATTTAAATDSAARAPRCFEFMLRFPPNTSEVGGRPLRPPLPLGPAGEISPPLNRNFVAVRALKPPGSFHTLLFVWVVRRARAPPAPL